MMSQISRVFCSLGLVAVLSQVGCGSDADDPKTPAAQAGAAGQAGSGQPGGQAGSGGAGQAGAGAGGGVAYTVDDFAGGVVGAYCKVAAACCSKFGFKSDEMCQMGASILAFSAGMAKGFDPAAAKACVEASMKAADAGAMTCDDAEDSAVLSACAKVFAGSEQPPGGPCYSSFQCSSAKGEASCNIATSPGKCEVEITVDAGQPCDVGVTDKSEKFLCKTGLFCGGEPPTCLSRAPMGGDCDVFNNPCVEDGFCKDSKCQPASKPGEACDSEKECVRGASCNEGKCLPNFIALTCK